MKSILNKAYLETIYKVIYNKEHVFVLYIEQKNMDFEKWCKKNNIKCWAIITAFNPFSKKCSDSENEQKNIALKNDLVLNGYYYVSAKGIPATNNWKPEKGFFIGNMSLTDAKKMGEKYEQNAIVYGSLNMLPKLIWIA